MFRSRLLRPLWLLLITSALPCGCASVGSRTWNLEQLHAEDSSYRYTGALMGDLEFTLRQQLLGPSTLFRTGLARKEPGPIENPSLETLDALLGLAELNSGDRLTRARQIQWFARLSVEDPGTLCRERAFLGLAQAAQALAPIEPEAGPKPAEASSQAALSSVLGELVRTARAASERGLSAADAATRRADLEASCELVRTRALDFGGARRALEVATSLAESYGFDDPRMASLAALVEHLERRCTARALAIGLGDRSGLALGAALQATIALYGAQVLPGVLNQLRPDSDPLVVRAVLEGLEQHGLQRKVDGGPLAEELIRQQELALIEIVLTRSESELRVAAMRVLSRHAASLQGEGALESLREEDWQRWHEQRQLARRAAEGTGL